MTKREYIETFLWVIAAIVMASTGIQYAEGIGRVIFCILTFGICVAGAYLLNCYIDRFGGERKQSNTKKGEG